jgi:hypothetical protein
MPAEYFTQLVEYTKEICAYFKVPFDAHGRPNYRKWDNGSGPTGLLEHFTASNSAVTPARPCGRIPYLLQRFAINSGTPGVQFIVWDTLQPEFGAIRAKYPVFKELECDVFSWGLDKAFYHGNAANGWAAGVENRNVGTLTQKKGKFFWNTTVPYVGRDPINVRGFWCEPYTVEQIKANILILRWLREVYPIEPHKVLGHLHITSNRTDPSPHFPLALVRKAAFEDAAVPFEYFRWLDGFRSDPDFFNRYDEWLEELIVSDTDEEDIFAREDPPEYNFEDIEALYGEDKQVSMGDVQEALHGLQQLEYYPVGDDKVKEWTIRLFQSRWVKKVGAKWVSTMRVNGTLDAPTVKKLNQMLHYWKSI